MRIGLFSYDLQDLSTDYNITTYSVTLFQDFGTLPLDTVGEKSIDLSSSPVVIPPGLWAVGMASSIAGSPSPTLAGATISFNADVPACLTTASTGIRSYGNRRNTGNFASQAENGFQTTPIISNDGFSSTYQQGLANVFFRGYMTQD
jgi:hypothetical protein